MKSIGYIIMRTPPKSKNGDIAPIPFIIPYTGSVAMYRSKKTAEAHAAHIGKWFPRTHRKLCRGMSVFVRKVSFEVY